MDAENPELALAAVRTILAKLGDDLELAFNSNPERNWPGYERARYAHALAAVAKFLEATTKSQELSKRFYRLALALGDLDNGIVDPLLESSNRKARSSTTIISCARAKVALGVYALVRAGLSRRQAAERVAGNFPQIRKLAAFERDKSSSTDTKILNWYDEFGKLGKKNRITNKVARGIFENGQQLVDSLPRESLEDFVEEYLRRELKPFRETSELRRRPR